ncbi:unnamed protein product [Angiostrongylus costaricensis]|uniref:Aminotran_1_2 domain-containing protein n=1 Tax=Angiostrongylus costaricensis TaxID=334426 RepID=A0A0R3Q1E5_ANGCS|nr:unnamed protein product [Angiostrongylus costaricensis]
MPLLRNVLRPLYSNGRRAHQMTTTFRPAERVRVEFTTLAAECNAVNLGQGFPDGPMPMFMSDILKEVAAHPEKTAWHQYTRVEFPFGHPRLVNVLAKLYSGLYSRQISANDEVLVTVGAYLSLYYSFMGFINHGDEVLSKVP